MTDTLPFDPDTVWLDHVQPVGLVVASSLLKELGLAPPQQTQRDTAEVAELISPEDGDGPALSDPWAFASRILKWEAGFVAGTPEGDPLPEDLHVALPEYETTLAPTWAVRAAGGGAPGWQLLVRIEPAGVEPDARNALVGWEATPHQRFERLLRETGVGAGVLITDNELRLVYAPRGETSGWLGFPLRALRTVAGRPMLAGLKLILGRSRLFTAPEPQRLPALLRASREAQAHVSTTLSEQVLGALHELLRGLSTAEPDLVKRLAAERPQHLYEGLLTILLRLVFILYAEDRDLIPSRTDATARDFYQQGYSVRGLHARLLEDAARNPDTMEERRGAWGRLLATFRLVHAGDGSGWIRGRGGKLFNPDAFPFLEGRMDDAAPPRVALVSDGAVLRILDGLLTLKGERLSYRTLDVEQIGSVYETVMGFTVEVAQGPVLAIKAGKNNRTPVFVDLAELASAKPVERLKKLREGANRGSLSRTQEAAVKAAKTTDELAAALEPIADERASPQRRVAPTGTPILQPTDERRRTGSHYTPRSLTEPIVRHALEPAFERLGEDATPDQVLDLKVCDPAMGSGAFLVEACRALAARLVKAWACSPEARPVIPPDEDEELHARRLVAQRCLYGVDKNPMAVDLARLSLWLATLARDHEFTFLNHALKPGDSLVGLTRAQIAALHWDTSKPPTFVGHLVKQHLKAAETIREEIRKRAEDETETVLSRLNREAEARLRIASLLGDGVIAAFFGADKPRKRIERLVEFQKSAQTQLGRTDWTELGAASSKNLSDAPHPIRPFHWELEFPEVFSRDNPGFDAIVGNPPFAGKNTIAAGNRDGYLDWLQTLHEGAHGNADIVAHFFRRAFALLRRDGCFGLIATKTIRQGDTRESGLAAILKVNGTITRATRRLKWPGEAAVVVSVVHMVRGSTQRVLLDNVPVHRVSAYLVEGDLDDAPQKLAENGNFAFVGSYPLGSGFLFSDDGSRKGESEGIEKMHALISGSHRNQEVIFPFIGGEEVTTDPCHEHHRYAIDFFDRPLARVDIGKSWFNLDQAEVSECRARGIAPIDYPGEVAEDWPDLVDIVRRLVKPVRDTQKRKALRERWWQYAEKRPGLYRAISGMKRIFVNSSKATPHHAFALLPNGMRYSQNLNVFAFENLSVFCLLSCRVHEVYARFAGTTMKDDFTYAVEDCFKSFPFPRDVNSKSELETAGQDYCSHRAQLMVRRKEGLTKTYNRFHDPEEKGVDILRLRELHDAMDRAVLCAYGWNDLIPWAVPIDLNETNEDDHTYKGRYFWPADVRDEVLARLLALNATRAAEERALGLTPLGGLGVGEDEELEEIE